VIGGLSLGALAGSACAYGPAYYGRCYSQNQPAYDGWGNFSGYRPAQVCYLLGRWRKSPQGGALTFLNFYLIRSNLFRRVAFKLWCPPGTQGGPMIKSRKAIGKQALKYAMTGIAVSCLGAAVFAAPMTITPKAKLFNPPQQRTGETKTVYAPLGRGPAFQLGRGAAGEDEDCVRVTRMVGPDGRVYVMRGLICQD
jgi:hypothetical protein